jgi:hypothetical protein
VQTRAATVRLVLVGSAREKGFLQTKWLSLQMPNRACRSLPGTAPAGVCAKELAIRPNTRAGQMYPQLLLPIAIVAKGPEYRSPRLTSEPWFTIENVVVMAP